MEDVACSNEPGSLFHQKTGNMQRAFFESEIDIENILYEFENI